MRYIRELPDLSIFEVWNFCRQLKPNKKTGCIEWQGHIPVSGYGQFKTGGKYGPTFFVHRIAYWLATKTKPPVTLEVCHSCNNRKCCNPDHLYLDTSKGNIQYAAAQGRMHGSSKLTAGDVLRMRKQAAKGKSTQEIADEYLLSPTTIRGIVSHRSWKGVGGPVVKRKGGFTKLTLSQVKYIKKSKIKGAILALKFNVTPSTISNVRLGRTFNNLE
jgi:hypothetical protein